MDFQNFEPRKEHYLLVAFLALLIFLLLMQLFKLLIIIAIPAVIGYFLLARR